MRLNMQSVVDVYGTALASYYNGNKFGELIVREDNATSIIPTAHFFKCPDEVVTDKIALSYCQSSVLNIDASSGEHSLYLLERGMKVCSLETSPLACSIMHQRGIPSIVCGHIFEQHVCFESTKTWLALNGTIGRLGTINNFIHFLELAQRYLLTTGHLILSSNDLMFEGYRTKRISVEFDGCSSEQEPWFDIGISTLKILANNKGFNCRIVYSDDSLTYVALLIKQ